MRAPDMILCVAKMPLARGGEQHTVLVDHSTRCTYVGDELNCPIRRDEDERLKKLAEEKAAEEKRRQEEMKKPFHYDE